MKRSILMTLMIVIIASSQINGQIKFDPHLYGNFGYENNIFRSPDLLELRDGSVLDETGLIISDSYLDLGYDLNAKYKAEKHIIRLSHDLWKRMYNNNSTLNQFKTNVKFNYDYKIIKRMHIGVIYRFDRVNKIGTSVLGDELTQQFSYNKNKVQLHYKYNVTKRTSFDLSGEYYKKTFDKLLNVTPLDYTNKSYSFGFNQKFYLKQVIFKAGLDLDFTSKTFTNKVALDQFGDLLPTNPVRTWNYYSGKFSLKASFPRGFEIAPCVKYKIRKDLFEDYYSYNSLMYGFDLSYESKRLEINLSPKYQSLDYLVKTAPDPDTPNDPLLNYTYFTGSVDISYKVYKGVYLSFEYINKLRETNTLDFSKKTRRAYKYYELMGGLIIKPMEFFK